jgi:hypothetical protein
VVINDFHVIGIPVFPAKADTPLVIDPDAWMARAIHSPK